jgi:hypothetical protein
MDMKNLEKENISTLLSSRILHELKNLMMKKKFIIKLSKN